MPVLNLPKHHIHDVLESSSTMLHVYHIWFFVFLAAAIISLVALFKPSKGTAHRMGPYLSFAINFVAAMSYFAMAHKQGRVWNIEDKTAYEVYWARYADWVITTPLLLTHLILFAGLAWQQWLFVLLSDVGMIVTGLIGAFITDETKWAWFVFACVLQAIVALELFGPARSNALAVSQKQGNIYMTGLLYLIIVWSVYPIVWALETGTHYISPSSAAFVYAILDFLAKPCFSALLYYLHAQLEESSDADGSAREGLLESNQA